LEHALSADNNKIGKHSYKILFGQRMIFYGMACFTCSLPPLKRQNYDPEPHQAPYETLPFSYERLGRMETDQMQLQMP
jgi:hypothetical protein